MNLLKIIFPIINADSSYPSQLGFQEPATPVMEGIINFHNDLMFFIIITSILVSLLLARCSCFFNFCSLKKPLILIIGRIIAVYHIWTDTLIFIMSIAVPSFFFYCYFNEIINPFIKITEYTWYYPLDAFNLNINIFFFNSYSLLILKKKILKWMKLLVISSFILLTPILIKIVVTNINSNTVYNYEFVKEVSEFYKTGSMYIRYLKTEINLLVNNFARSFFVSACNFNTECSNYFAYYLKKPRGPVAHFCIFQFSWIDSMYIPVKETYSPLIKKDIFVYFLNKNCSSYFLSKFVERYVELLPVSESFLTRTLYPHSSDIEYTDWIQIYKSQYHFSSSNMSCKLSELKINCYNSLLEIENPEDLNKITNCVSEIQQNTNTNINKYLILFISISFVCSSILVTNLYI